MAYVSASFASNEMSFIEGQAAHPLHSSTKLGSSEASSSKKIMSVDPALATLPNQPKQQL
jgi:hypothetical protein